VSILFLEEVQLLEAAIEISASFVLESLSKRISVSAYKSDKYL
jgi:hypothetical protein